ncbi:carbohydrate ABC transporter permease [Sinomonas terrae]|uniref:Sugar ABC transporter permease n=1 Tax=Sinomonas terrae TaxID=2908838 RepID=A0ABS9TYQ5_9MICC|nr:sugar ABC transporter permease [Sinomonas terrae]MCH6469508.1 sugar ABC transporter permease [Sinomonas terrae]
MTTITTSTPRTLRATPTKAGSLGGGTRQSRPAWLFLAPFAVIYLAFLIGPTLYMIVASFFNTSLVRSGLGTFAGLANYAEMLTRPDFWNAMWHTVQFTLYTTPPLVVLGFVMAILTNRVGRGQWFFRLAFFVPFILPSASIALIWSFIFTPDTGLLNEFQAFLGLAPTPVLADPAWAMAGVAAATVWWTIGFNFILYLAALQDIPRELYEAAAVDGASPWQQIRFITIPLLGRTTTLVILLQIIASLKIFDQIYLMTSGGPGQSTNVALTFIANTAFTSDRVGAASAASVLLFIAILLIAAARQLLTRAQDARA